MYWEEEIRDILRTRYPSALDIDVRCESYGVRAYVRLDMVEYYKSIKAEIFQIDKYEFELVEPKVQEDMMVVVFAIHLRAGETG